MSSILEEQAREIEKLCRDAGLEPDAMAERAGVKPDSMRKIIKGYQPCSPQLMQSFRNIVEMERLRMALNKEFERLFELSKWTKERAAKELGLSAAEVAAILSGARQPEPIVLRSFKLRVGDTRPMPDLAFQESATPWKTTDLQAWERDLIAELRQLEESDRKKAIQGIKTLLSVLPKRKKQVQGARM